MWQNKHKCAYSKENGSDTEPPRLVATPPKVADGDDAQHKSDVDGAGNESRHDTGELVAPLNGGEDN